MSKKPTIREQLENANKMRDYAERCMTALRWYVRQHGKLPPPETTVAVAGQRGIAMWLVTTDETGLPVAITESGTQAAREAESFMVSLAYDPLLPPEQRQRHAEQLAAWRAAERELREAP